MQCVAQKNDIDATLKAPKLSPKTLHFYSSQDLEVVTQWNEREKEKKNAGDT